MERWHPPQNVTPQEEHLLKRLTRVRKLFAFLRLHRHTLFDAAFQAELATMYRDTGAGDAPCPPALLAMATLLQGYVRASDAEAVELTVTDLRWQMVLGCLGATEPPFSQGALQAFRSRLVAHDMDRVLLERSVALARTTGAADPAALSSALRVALDSRPLAGAGRVEDTINLLGHAARSIVRIVASVLDREPEEICRRAGTPLLLAPSIKAGLDLDWSDPTQRAEAVATVERQVSRLHHWVERHLPTWLAHAPLTPYIEALVEVQAQDLTWDERGRASLREGVLPERRVSIEDAEMRHGRKSRSKRFDGYKEHIARDLDTPVIVACAVTPANRPEERAAAALKADIERQALTIAELSIDRAYLASPVVDEVRAAGGVVLCKPWPQGGRDGRFGKRDFRIDLRRKVVTCPAGQRAPLELGAVTKFDPAQCARCPLRAHCTTATSGRGRTVAIAADEAEQKRLRARQGTRAGRAALRQRVPVEHALAHIAARKGSKARYVGARKNLFDLRRAATIQNLEATQRLLAEAA